MSKNPRQIRRGPGGGARRNTAKPPAVVSQGVIEKTESARQAEPNRPKVLYGAALERERFVSRLPVTSEDVRRHQLNLALFFVAGVLALAFAAWTVVSAVQEAAAADPANVTTPIWPSIIAGVAGFFAMYFIFLGVREWRQGPRSARAGKRGKRR